MKTKALNDSQSLINFFNELSMLKAFLQDVKEFQLEVDISAVSNIYTMELLKTFITRNQKLVSLVIKNEAGTSELNGNFYPLHYALFGALAQSQTIKSVLFKGISFLDGFTKAQYSGFLYDIETLAGKQVSFNFSNCFVAAEINQFFAQLSDLPEDRASSFKPRATEIIRLNFKYRDMAKVWSSSVCFCPPASDKQPLGNDANPAIHSIPLKPKP